MFFIKFRKFNLFLLNFLFVNFFILNVYSDIISGNEKIVVKCKKGKTIFARLTYKMNNEPDEKLNNKQIKRKKKYNEKQKKAFQNELTVIQTLNKKENNHIVKLIKHDENKLILDEEWADYDLTDFLNKYLKKKETLDIKIKLKILIDIISAIIYIHNNGFVHRDIKPENVLIFGDTVESVKLCDFSFSRKAAQGSSYAECEDFLGTLGYISPNNIIDYKKIATKEGDKKYSVYFADDIYAFGVLMYTTLTDDSVKENFQRFYKKNFCKEIKLDDKNFDNYYVFCLLNKNFNPCQLNYSEISEKFYNEQLYDLVQLCCCFEWDNRPSAQAVLDSLIKIQDEIYNQEKKYFSWP